VAVDELYLHLGEDVEARNAGTAQQHQEERLDENQERAKDLGGSAPVSVPFFQGMLLGTGEAESDMVRMASRSSPPANAAPPP
jgi:hypothetical protein